MMKKSQVTIFIIIGILIIIFVLVIVRLNNPNMDSESQEILDLSFYTNNFKIYTEACLKQKFSDAKDIFGFNEHEIASYIDDVFPDCINFFQREYDLEIYYNENKIQTNVGIYTNKITILVELPVEIKRGADKLILSKYQYEFPKSSFVKIEFDNDGKIAEDIDFFSSDINARLYLKQGNKIYDINYPLIYVKMENKPDADFIVGEYVYDFTPNGLKFENPTIVEFRYDESQVENEFDLNVGYLDNGVWISIPTYVDTENNIIRTLITHFSEYTLVNWGSNNVYEDNNNQCMRQQPMSDFIPSYNIQLPGNVRFVDVGECDNYGFENPRIVELEDSATVSGTVCGKTQVIKLTGIDEHDVQNNRLIADIDNDDLAGSILDVGSYHVLIDGYGDFTLELWNKPRASHSGFIGYPLYEDTVYDDKEISECFFDPRYTKDEDLKDQHHGTDFKVYYAKVISSFNGVVEHVGFDDKYGYNIIISAYIPGTCQKVCALYGDLNRSAWKWIDDPIRFPDRIGEIDNAETYPWRVGEEVKQGEIVGTSGNTGYSKLWHLHYELRLNDCLDRGYAVNPMYLEQLLSEYFLNILQKNNCDEIEQMHFRDNIADLYPPLCMSPLII